MQHSLVLAITAEIAVAFVSLRLSQVKKHSGMSLFGQFWWVHAYWSQIDVVGRESCLGTNFVVL